MPASECCIESEYLDCEIITIQENKKKKKIGRYHLGCNSSEYPVKHKQIRNFAKHDCRSLIINSQFHLVDCLLYISNTLDIPGDITRENLASIHSKYANRGG